MNQQLRTQPRTTAKWAPWWVYFVTVGTNYLRRAAFPDGSSPATGSPSRSPSPPRCSSLTLVYRPPTTMTGLVSAG